MVVCKVDYLDCDIFVLVEILYCNVIVVYVRECKCYGIEMFLLDECCECYDFFYNMLDWSFERVSKINK